ncbi:MAG TPA: hypothetical protein VFF73_08050 [Planctomycetota bacterium]|nr:hypothetical protein [Planctomycetota bacterium]
MSDELNALKNELEERAERTFKVAFSPDFVDGAVAGDIIRITDVASGEFKVLRRGPNVAIKVFSLSDITGPLEDAKERLAPLKARLDGRVANACVFTVQARHIERARAAMRRVEKAYRTSSGSWMVRSEG